MGSSAHDRNLDDHRRPWVDHFTRDVQHALRMIRKTPGFSALAILTLAIGVGATTAIFSVVDATLLRPLPYRDPGRLMSLFLRMPVQNGAAREIDMVWSYPKYQALVRAQRAFSELSPKYADAYPVGSPEGADLVRGESVGASYFHLLGISPERGRFFTREEDRPTGGDRVVVLSDAFWRERFGASASAIGSTLDIGGQPFTIIGIAPPGFAGMSGSARLWPLLTAMRSADQLQQVNSHNFDVVARLATGESIIGARNAMIEVGRNIDATYPNDVGHWRAAGYTLDELRVDPLVGKSVLILAGAVSLLLIIACVNVASLLLARGAARRRELAVRMAIGASRNRLISQLLTESAVLAGAGVLIGLLLAFLGVRALASMAPLSAANLNSSRGNLTALALGGIALDWRSVLFSTAIALAAGLAAGLAPALSAAKTSLAEAMRQSATTDAAFTGLRRITTRGVLIVAEIALAVILLVGSGLMIRSLSQLFDTPLGYQPDHLLTARVTLNASRARVEPSGQLWDEITRRIGAMPGVVSAAITSCAPVGDHCDGTDVSIPGHIGRAHVSYIVVSSNYFATIGASLLRGRDVARTDSPGGRSVLLVNNTAARAIWGNDNPLTAPIPGEHPIDIVGVVSDVRFEDLESPAKPAIFAPIGQSGRRTALLVVRTGGDPAALGPALRRELRAIDRNHVITEVKTMRERLFESAARNRFASRVMSTFAIVALSLAGLGIYGVISLAVTQRRREFSVRIALGATQSRILGMVMSEAFSLVAVGAVLGIAGAFVAARAMTSLLYGVTPADTTTYIASAAVLAVAALVAALIPASRAMCVQPAAVLRGD